VNLHLMHASVTTWVIDTSPASNRRAWSGLNCAS